MPLTASHAEWGSLDATLADLGNGAGEWEQLHKVRPRAPLTCRGCDRGMHAKVSKLGLRFFAHDAAVSACPHNGETPAQRLLKSELAAAVRATGWTAELEVTGTGWRADVLATSPDRRRRVAWQAQLVSATVNDVAGRTAAMLAELDDVCWVSDKDAAWIAHVPSARVRRDTSTTALMIIDGVVRFEPLWCRDRRLCDYMPGYAFAGRAAPCPGHGTWRPPIQLSLDVLVAAVSADTVGVHHVTAWRDSAPSRHYDTGTTVWTAKRYVEQEREQLDATEAFERRRRAQEAEEVRHRLHTEALLQRQQALIKPTVERVYRETGGDVMVPKRRGDPYWAMGVPVSVPSGPCAVVCPVASRIDSKVRSRLAPVLLVVADEQERARVAAKCDPEQRIVVIAV